ncbi:MAG: aminopeptidase N [Micrococcales bacterium]|nr:aminopeptidase N [Micrococcales bacterium]
MAGENLTREDAAERAELITVSTCDVALDVTIDEATFPTRSTIRFAADRPGASTFVDFLGASVDSITLNGRPLDPSRHYDGARVTLPELAADNEVVIEATGRFMNTGEGLHRFVDPVDNQVYLYTQFEVADARRMFPVFDQPDLKARFAFTVTAPAHWQVISCQPTPEPVPVGERVSPGSDPGLPVATWAFEATPPLSSYVTALVAGPYEVVRDELTSRDGRVVPLGLFCRASLREHLDPEALFELTKAGFTFYETEFDLAYPFAKYDQIFTPEFNAGAMENVGAVTFNEMYVFRARETQSRIERRALTLLHELAHMWFGDLVTMRWWDDLWLNESFAEWASTTAQAEATRWTTAWTTFATAEKNWAYRQDQLSSTHPIVAPIRHLEDVEANFDGITYAKGASVLKQLVAYVGRDAFREGLRAYFRAHAWGNTTMADLLRELESASGRDLSTWSDAWLHTAGVNTLWAEVGVVDGVIAAAALRQSATPQFPTLRPHRLALGLYGLQTLGDSEAMPGRRLVRTERFEVDIDGPSTQLADLVGRPMPDVLLVNDDDLAYAKIRIDERSLETVTAVPAGFTDSLPQALVLGAMWDMTRDAQLTAPSFVRFALACLPAERDSTLVRVLLGQVESATRFYTCAEHRAGLAAHVAEGLRDLALTAEPGSDAQLQFVTAFANWSQTPADLDLIEGLLEGTTNLDGLAVDTEMRWTLLTSLAVGGRADRARIDAERRRDDTATGRERAARALAARPTAQAKEDAWVAAVETPGLPNQTIDAIAQGFGRVHDSSLLLPYIQRYHDALDTVWRERTFAIAESIVLGFYPLVVADRVLLEASQQWLDTHPEAPDALVRLAAENRDSIARALQAQAFDAAAAQ